MMEHAFRMPVIRAVALALSLFALSATARAETLASPWVEGYNNKVRLIAGKALGISWERSGALIKKNVPWAGIEILMPAGWKTYWRNPGEAGGVPPEFDWSGSENIRSTVVNYPAPHRFSDKSGQTIGYKEHIIFPIGFSPADPLKPVKLKLKASYGACKELCVPAEAELELTVPTELTASAELDEAVSRLPADHTWRDVIDGDVLLYPSKEAEEPAVISSRVDSASGKAKLVLEVSDPGITGGDAFLYSPDNLYLPLPKKISEAEGKAVYEADLSDSFNDLKGKSIGVVLTGAKGQSETIIQIPK